MVERKELQEKIIAYRILEARLDSLLKQRDMLASKLIEIQTTLQSIDEIEKSKEEVLFPIGSEAYTFGKIMDKKKVIVEIGANVALEKTTEDGRKILNKRRVEIGNALNSLQKNIVEISSSLEQLEPEIEELAKSLEKEQ
ncbi:MAG: prefoldin subunit alpha [Candidatus Aenigmarchaeota archaeon]|nr:prefoldin subunit alpha [Candidatus Aenigmarchaeota archaeon]